MKKTMRNFCTKSFTKYYTNIEKQARLSSVVKNVISNDYISQDHNMIMLMDLNHIKTRCSELKHSYSSTGLSNDNILHTFAMKAFQLPQILNLFNDENIGVECASFGELLIALNHTNIPSNNMIFDSPCKTYQELEYCIKNQISFNIDNFIELNRVKQIMDTIKDDNALPCNIGLRVNPVIGCGDIDYLSVSTQYSKFGINLEENKDELIDAFKQYSPWLNTIHCHVGSQGTGNQLLSDGISKIVEFADTINSINTINIGGGLSISYESDIDKPSYYDLVNLFKTKSPQLFSNEYKIITEYGRSLIGKSGYVMSKVEYVKKTNDKYIVTIHCGANVLLRAAYTPNVWKHHFSVYNKYGEIKEEGINDKNYVYDIVGPLCFGGDIMGKNISFPFMIEEGDYIVIHDCGTNSINMYSIHNSRPIPPVYGFQDESNINMIYSGQTYQQVADSWS